MHVCALSLAPPSGWDPLGDGSALSDLLDAAKAVGARTARFDVSNRSDFESAWATLCGGPSTGDVTIVVISAHGRRIRRASGAGYDNMLLLADTKPNDVVRTGLDLDRIAGDLFRSAADPVVLVVDACEVDLQAAAGGARGAALLASPGRQADVTRAGGVLTSSLAKSLTRCARRGSTLREVLRDAQDTVLSETMRRQEPGLRTFGNGAFLDGVRVEIGSPGAEALSETLTALSISQRLGAPAAKAMLEAIRGRTDAEAERARLALMSELLLSDPDPEIASQIDRQLRRLDPSEDKGIAMARSHHAQGWYLGKHGTGRRDGPRAISHLEDALAASPRGEAGLRGIIHDTLGTVSRDQGRWDEAVGHYREAREQKQACGDILGLGMTRTGLGWSLLAAGRFIEGQSEFETGVIEALAGLDAPPEADPRSLMGVLDGLAFHLHGLCVAHFTLGTPQSSFMRLRAQVQEWTRLAPLARRWGGFGPYDLAEVLLDIGCRDMRALAGRDSWPEGCRLWEAVARFAGEGGAAAQHVTGAVTDLATSLKAKERASALAAASLLFHRRRNDQTTAILETVIDSLRRTRRVIDPPTAWPWHVGGGGAAVDTSDWPEWGPLRAQKVVSSRPGLVFHPSVTEQFLQVLAWTAALVMCVEGAVSERQAIDALRAAAPKGADKVLLTLNTAFSFARDVANLSRPGSDWGRRLAESFRALEPLQAGGYDDLSALTGERNDASHRTPLGESEAKAIVGRHQEVIAAVAELVGPALGDVVADPAGELGPHLYGAVLKTTRGNAFRCGPLLALTDAGHFAMPHIWSMGALGASGRGRVSFQVEIADGVESRDVDVEGAGG